MTTNYSPIYNGNGFTDLEITLEAMIMAGESVELRKQFAEAVRANAQQGYNLLLNPLYFASIKQFINSMEDVQYLDAKRRWGERLLRDSDYVLTMASLAIKQSVNGIASLNSQGQQVIRALIPARIESGVFQPIPDGIIVQAVAELSNDNTLIRILISQGEL